MKKRGLSGISLLLLCWILILPSASEAQFREDVPNFKNEKVLREESIKNSQEKDSLFFKPVSRKVILAQTEHVDDIKRETTSTLKYYKEAGSYINNTGIAILPGSDNTTVRFQIVNGYQFTTRFSAGIGVGFTRYDAPFDLVPIFLSLKYKLLKANAVPFVSFQAGRNFTIWTADDLEIDDHRGAVMLSPGVGVQFETSKGFGWYFKTGFNLDRASYEQGQWGGRTVVTELKYRRLNLGFGLIF